MSGRQHEASSGEAPPRVSVGFMARYAFAQYACWVAIFTPVVLTVAIKISRIVPAAEKGSGLSAVMTVGAVFALAAAPVFGALSDRTASRWGPRVPWMALGPVVLLAGLVIMAISATLLQVGIGLAVCQTGANITQAALNATMPDMIPPAQRGRMAGLLGMTPPLAIVTGTFLTQFTTGNDLVMFVVPWLPSVVALPLLIRVLPRNAPGFVAPLARSTSARRNFWINPVRHPDFAWAFISRFLVTLAAAFSQTYQVYFLTDRIGLPSSRVAATLVATHSAIAVMTIVLTPLGGWLSDRTRRVKPFVLFPAFVIAAGTAIISTSSTLTPFMVGVSLVGIGLSVYYAVDMALCVAVLPNRANSAKDLGMIQIANSLPQSIAPAIAPMFLMIGGGGQNFPAVFVAATVIALAGAISVLPIKAVR